MSSFQDDDPQDKIRQSLPDTVTIRMKPSALPPELAEKLAIFIAEIRDQAITEEAISLETGNTIARYEKHSHADGNFDKIVRRTTNYREEVEERTKSGRRAKRRRSEFEDPSRRSDAQVNRKDEVFQTRVESDFKEAVNAEIERRGLTKKEALVQAFEMWLAQDDPREPS